MAIVAPEALPDLAALGNNPARYLASQKPSARPATQELALLALIVLADNNPEAAATELAQRWSRHLTAAQRAWAWGAIGQQAAKSLSDDALRYFSPSGLARPRRVAPAPVARCAGGAASDASNDGQ